MQGRARQAPPEEDTKLIKIYQKCSGSARAPQFNLTLTWRQFARTPLLRKPRRHPAHTFSHDCHNSEMNQTRSQMTTIPSKPRSQMTSIYLKNLPPSSFQK